MKMRESGSAIPSAHCPRALQPGHGRDLDLPGVDELAKELLQDQADPPGGQQRVERTLVEITDQAALQRIAEHAGDDECQHDPEEDVDVHQPGEETLEQHGSAVAAVRPHGHQLAVGHVDDAHEAEHDRQPQRHQHQDREDAQPGESLHGEHVEIHFLPRPVLAGTRGDPRAPRKLRHLQVQSPFRPRGDASSPVC